MANQFQRKQALLDAAEGEFHGMITCAVELLSLVRSLRKEGVPVAVIAEHIGVPDSTVRSWLRSKRTSVPKNVFCGFDSGE